MRSTRLTAPTILLLLVALPAQAQNSEPKSSIERNPAWATPVLDVPEVERLFLVEANFYRSAQPAPEGFKALVARKGLRTVVNLRATHSDDALTQGLGLRLFHFGMPAWHIEREDVAAALRTLRSETRAGPTLLHCTLGADRTGLWLRSIGRSTTVGASRKPWRRWNMAILVFTTSGSTSRIFIDQIDLDQLKRDVAVP